MEIISCSKTTKNICSFNIISTNKRNFENFCNDIPIFHDSSFEKYLVIANNLHQTQKSFNEIFTIVTPVIRMDPANKIRKTNQNILGSNSKKFWLNFS